MTCNETLIYIYGRLCVRNRDKLMRNKAMQKRVSDCCRGLKLGSDEEKWVNNLKAEHCQKSVLTSSAFHPESLCIC